MKEWKKNVYVCYLPKIGEPFDQLCGIVLIEFDIGEVHFEYGWAWVPYPKEHQLRFTQMHRSQCWRVHRSQGNLLLSNKLFVFFCIVNFMSFAIGLLVWFFFCFSGCRNPFVATHKPRVRYNTKFSYMFGIQTWTRTCIIFTPQCIVFFLFCLVIAPPHCESARIESKQIGICIAS